MAALTYSYNPTTAIGRVRRLIGDAPSADAVSALLGTRDTWPCLFADEEIAAALADEHGDLVETACALLEAAAASAAHVAVALRVGDYSQDLRAVPEALRARALALRARAQTLPAEAIVEETNTVFQARARLIRDALRQGPDWGGP